MKFFKLEIMISFVCLYTIIALLLLMKGGTKTKVSAAPETYTSALSGHVPQLPFKRLHRVLDADNPSGSSHPTLKVIHFYKNFETFFRH